METIDDIVTVRTLPLALTEEQDDTRWKQERARIHESGGMQQLHNE